MRPSRIREMAKKAVEERNTCIRVACEAFRISESCYRYERKLNAENDVVANWLIRLTDNHRNWGFGLCYLYLRNVKGFKWNHKRVYRIYKELELNLRIKPLRIDLVQMQHPKSPLNGSPTTVVATRRQRHAALRSCWD